MNKKKSSRIKRVNIGSLSHEESADKDIVKNEIGMTVNINEVIDNNRYAYEKAIEAYWKHVDRYHTWMNYYAIFNGALFVGFCTLKTATSYVYKVDNCYELINNYEYFCLMICLLGVVASICWLTSILGHEKWECNWMNIIEKYEKDTPKVYKLIRVKRDDMKIESLIEEEHSRVELKGKDVFKAFSTHSITKTFVSFIFIGWCMTTIIIGYDFIKSFKCIFCLFSLVILIIIILNVGIKYSNVNGKSWEDKDKK